MFTDNSIIITSKDIKKQILLNRDSLINIKIYDVNEFKNLYYKISSKTLSYIKKKYNVTLEIAKIYLDDLFYIVDKLYNNKKLDFLRLLKKDLIDNNYLELNINFINFISGKKVYIYNLRYEKDITKLENILNTICVTKVINDNINNFNHKIYSFDNINLEVAFIAEEISNLLKKGIDLNHIYLINLKDYRNEINTIFKMFNLPVTLNDKTPLINTSIAINFLKNYDLGIPEDLTFIKNLIKTKEDEDVYNLIIDIVNKYADLEDDLYDLLVFEFKNTKINKPVNKKSIREVNLDYKFKDDDYVFMVGFNDNTPSTFKDENFLSNKELQMLGLDTTTTLNKNEKLKYLGAIKNIYNLTITATLNEKQGISNLNEILNFEVIKKEKFISKYSDIYNKMELSKQLDLYYKYKTISKNLNALYNHYNKLEYKSYNHSFKGISKDSLKKYLNNSLTLSYSSLDKYFRCPFSFYINNILKLKENEDTFAVKVGRIFHTCLEKYNENFDKIFINAVKKEGDFSKKDEFFLQLLKKEIKNAIEEIKFQNNYSKLKNELHEQKICVNISKEIEVKFVGIIDKIKFLKENNKTYAAIIDYKTGNVSTSLSTIKYGIGMQLPTYLYLIKNYNSLKNVSIVGLYLQKVLDSKIAPGVKNYEEEKKKNYLLQGYSNSNQSILEKFDTTFMDSKLIKGMKVKKDDNFYNYSKVLTEEEFERIYNITFNNINKGIDDIISAKFPIEPKKINNENLGCTFCKFKDICFSKASDIKELKEMSKEEVLEV